MICLFCAFFYDIKYLRIHLIWKSFLRVTIFIQNAIEILINNFLKKKKFNHNVIKNCLEEHVT